MLSVPPSVERVSLSKVSPAALCAVRNFYYWVQIVTGKKRLFAMHTEMELDDLKKGGEGFAIRSMLAVLIMPARSPH